MSSPEFPLPYDLVVVGGGIVGLATARAAVLAKPSARILVVEKESAVGLHQSGRNSNVIHAGVYYKPGSQKSALCTAGRLAMVEYCRDRGIAHEVCGKVVVATRADELARLSDLESRCAANGVEVERVGPERLGELEPHAVGVAALHVKGTGIADYSGVCDSLADELRSADVEVRVGVAVLGGIEKAGITVLSTSLGEVSAHRVVTCAGLQADVVARSISGPEGDGGLRIIPFRGEYFELAHNKTHLVRSLIYPVPDPEFPFLGVHLTRGVNGRIHAGPNAVLALAREGYNWRTVDPGHLAGLAKYSGFRKLAARHWKYGLDEMLRSASRKRFTTALQRLVPEIEMGDLEPSPAGVRAQAVARDGSLVDDFAFVQRGPVLHVMNAPSPAATASLEIGKMIVERLALA